jgi:hypothetical protein
MKKKIVAPIIILLLIIFAGISGCQKTDLVSNPNAVSDNSTVPVSLILNHMSYSIYAGGGVLDNRPGYVYEYPWDLPFVWGQYFVSNYQYYRGTNFYNWGGSATAYDLLKYANKMQDQNVKQYGSASNKYTALGQFFRAYSFIWLTQRVGDIPMTQAGNPNILTPTYDSQHDVYKNCLALLDSANTIMGSLINASNAGSVLDANGDIYGLTYIQWQQVINTYKLRILISLSKRAQDNPDLNIPAQFATIINNPTQYPIMGSNKDNMVFKYNAAYNPYSIFLRGNAPYNNYANMCKTILDLTTANQDPRTFIIATPAPAQLAGGKQLSDFTAYVGADINTDQATLNSDAAAGKYSYANYQRYYTSQAGANCEPYILVGYPEMCFNIAEAINRGWVTGNSTTWYTNGIKASLGVYGLTQGQNFTIGDNAGKTLGTVTIDINTFLASPNVVYAGDNAAGLTQILQQKYVAFFVNSGWEAFYNWRRTGVPNFSQGGDGIGTPNNQNLIPRRWQYPNDEAVYNTTNYNSAISSQFGGSGDNVSLDTWLTK